MECVFSAEQEDTYDFVSDFMYDLHANLWIIRFTYKLLCERHAGKSDFGIRRWRYVLYMKLYTESDLLTVCMRNLYTETYI
jgi:hypothetical protein